jgi:hypothetical protein
MIFDVHLIFRFSRVSDQRRLQREQRAFGPVMPAEGDHGKGTGDNQADHRDGERGQKGPTSPDHAAGTSCPGIRRGHERHRPPPERPTTH